MKQPKVINGVKQDAIQGTSLAYSVAQPEAPARHKVQYYEINGTRAIYKDGWKAATLHKTGVPFGQDVWELYNLNEDPTELHDLAAEKPAKLKELKALFASVGKKNHVFPLKDTLFKDFAGNHSAFKGQDKVELYPGTDQIFSLSAPVINHKAFSLTVDVEVPANGAEGVLVANGGRFGGSSIFIQDGKLHYAQNDGYNTTHIVSERTLQPGKAKVRVKFEPLTPQNANVSLYLNEERVGEGRVPLKDGIAYFAYDEGFDVGRDLQTPVAESYKAPFAFTGKLEKVTIDYKK